MLLLDLIIITVSNRHMCGKKRAKKRETERKIANHGIERESFAGQL